MVNEIEFRQNETTEIFTEVYLKEEYNIYLECIKHETYLKFRIFSGDSLYFQVFPCEKCLEEAIEKASLEKARIIINKIIEETDD